jgi:UDP-glucose 4-epimerase
MHILITGGAGYIGSHTAVELLQRGHTVVIVDNLSNSSREAVRQVEKITTSSLPFYELDVCDILSLEKVFAAHQFDAVIHFAGLKSVGESTEHPLKYYRNNIVSTLSLLECMTEHDVNGLVFSSSATVYGSAPVPYVESAIVGQGITNPYGQTKYVIEKILQDTAPVHNGRFTILRYFNPIGAHESGLIGENPHGVPNNLMPYITQVASGNREKLTVFGNDYPTVDGTGVRDYIHVTDLALGHVAAVENLKNGISVYNLGSGSGTSVLELLHAFEEATGIHIPYEIGPRRAGDLAEYYADAQKVYDELNWKSHKTVAEACADAWKWQSSQPTGFNET